MDNISFFAEDIDFDIQNEKQNIVWINTLINSYDKIPGEITYIFCSDEYLLEINKTHLNHDTLTDIITFDYSHAGIISGDIFISIDRIKANALEFFQEFFQELLRVMAHGVLHLIGFKDKNAEEKKEMTLAEDKALAIYELS